MQARAPSANAGLCDRCRHQRVVPNTRGSVFSLCERSKFDPEFPRYPRLPVARCDGFERREADQEVRPEAGPSPPGRGVPGEESR